MIEKLKQNEDKIYRTESGEMMVVPALNVPQCISDKINELVDAVNKLQEHEEKHLDLLTQLNEMRLQNIKKTESADPYAEQRKWIGRLCRFWTNSRDFAGFGVLGDITDKGNFVNIDTDMMYAHCEPVKPDDDIIYKGGKDE